MTQAASPEEVEREVKRGQALELRISGANYREIARAIRVSTGTAYTLVNEGLAELRNASAESTDELRRLEVARLDKMLLGLWPKRDNPRVADTILRLGERRSRLMGLDLGKTGGDEPPPPPPSSQLPATINITLVAPDGTKLSGAGTIPPSSETKPPEGGTNGSG